MRLFEAIAVILVGTVALMLIIRSTRAGILQRIAGDRPQLLATIASPLVVAAVIVAGLIALGAENLTGGVAARQMSAEHSSAVQNLFFRH